MERIETTKNQTIIDIAVKYYGTAEAVSELLYNNPDLRNDAASLALLGIDSLYDDGFYVDAALSPGQEVVIDTDSFMLKQNIAKEMQNKEINTFDL